jgi:c-di-GMP-binding flagellar brake protein YcgR
MSDHNALTALVTSEEQHDYELTSPVEVLFVLRALIHHRDFITVYFNQGRDFLLTALLGVDEKQQRFWFDMGGSAAMNQRILSSPRNIFVAAPQGIRIQFVTEQITSLPYEQRSALSAALPASLVKVQRREFYRVPMPVVNPVMCMASLADGHALNLATHDISLGGLCLISPLPRADLPPMTELPDCRMDIGRFGRIRFGLQIRHQRITVQKNGSEHQLIGCKFLGMSHATQASLQKFLIQMERERRALVKE